MKLKLATILTILFATNSCKVDPNYPQPPDNYYYLSAEQIAKTPYFTNPAFDTISFASNNGDTLTFAKTKTDTLYYKQFNSNCPDCPYWYNYYQELWNTYKTIKGNGKFKVRHAKLAYGENPDMILITLNQEEYNVYDRWLNKSFKYSYWLNDFTINNKQYLDVICVFSKLGDTSTNRMYLNKDYGCFYVDLIDKNLNWHLIK